MTALVSTGWLADHLGDPDLRVVDGSFKMPSTVPAAIEDYRREHIEGAVFFDIDDCSDHASSLPHMLPSAEIYSENVGRLGLGSGHRIVVYDANGLAGAARVWWSFRVFGHTRISVLDGGLRRWKAEGRAVTDIVPTPQPAEFMARFDPTLVRDKAQILANIDRASEQVLDARSAARFEGAAPEPWPGRRSGHIPGSLNLDHTTLADPATGLLRSVSDLRELFDRAGVIAGKPVVTSCGSGITATVLALALDVVGRTDVAVYDGSWAEWGLPGPLPIEKGVRKL